MKKLDDELLSLFEQAECPVGATYFSEKLHIPQTSLGRVILRLERKDLDGLKLASRGQYYERFRQYIELLHSQNIFPDVLMESNDDSLLARFLYDPALTVYQMIKHCTAFIFRAYSVFLLVLIPQKLVFFIIAEAGNFK